MGKNAIIAILVVLLLLTAGYGYYANQQVQTYKVQADQAMKTEQTMAQKQQETAAITQAQQQKQQEMMANTMTVNLNEENKSGESGTATLKEENGKVTVTIALTGFITGASQPAHIHIGDCPGVGKVLYPLTNVVNGQSVTTLATTLADLKKQFPLAINVHKSATLINVYTACGSLSASGSTTPSVSVSTTPAATNIPTAASGY